MGISFGPKSPAVVDCPRPPRPPLSRGGERVPAFGGLGRLDPDCFSGCMFMPKSAKVATSKPVQAPAANDRLPGWFPGWARELSDLYTSGTTCLFVLHGNVHDVVQCPNE